MAEKRHICISLNAFSVSLFCEKYLPPTINGSHPPTSPKKPQKDQITSKELKGMTQICNAIMNTFQNSNNTIPDFWCKKWSRLRGGY